MLGRDLFNGTENILSSNDAMSILKQLYSGANDGNICYQKIIEGLKNTDFHDRLDRNIDHALVAHKIGNLSEATNDIGLFYTNKPYILTVYTSDLANPNDVITGISDLVYDYKIEHDN